MTPTARENLIFIFPIKTITKLFIFSSFRFTELMLKNYSNIGVRYHELMMALNTQIFRDTAMVVVVAIAVHQWA